MAERQRTWSLPDQKQMAGNILDMHGIYQDGKLKWLRSNPELRPIPQFYVKTSPAFF